MKVFYGFFEYKYIDRVCFYVKWIEEYYFNGRYYWKGKILIEMLDLEFDGIDW